MNQGEYLRNKQRNTPKLFGPAKMGDESTRIMVHRFVSSTITNKHSPQIQCCRTYPNGVGYRQVSSRDAITSKSAGCEICAVGPPRYKHSITDCSSCTILTPYTYDPNVQKAAALMGKQTCCAKLPYVPRKPSPCCIEPGYINTFAANNVPAASIPVAPALGQCCEAPIKTVNNTIPCCDDTNFQ